MQSLSQPAALARGGGADLFAGAAAKDVEGIRWGLGAHQLNRAGAGRVVLKTLRPGGDLPDGIQEDLGRQRLKESMGIKTNVGVIKRVSARAKLVGARRND